MVLAGLSHMGHFSPPRLRHRQSIFVHRPPGKLPNIALSNYLLAIEKRSGRTKRQLLRKGHGRREYTLLPGLAVTLNTFSRLGLLVHFRESESSMTLLDPDSSLLIAPHQKLSYFLAKTQSNSLFALIRTSNKIAFTGLAWCTLM